MSPSAGQGMRSDVKSVILGESTSIFCAAAYLLYTLILLTPSLARNASIAKEASLVGQQSFFYVSICDGCTFSLQLLQLNCADSLLKCLITLMKPYCGNLWKMRGLFMTKTIFLWLIWGWTANATVGEIRLWFKGQKTWRKTCGKPRISPWCNYPHFPRKKIAQAGMKLMGQMQTTLSESQRKMDS